MKKILSLLLVLAALSSAQAKKIYVKSGTNGTSGSSWGTAFSSIDMAINNASDGDSIFVSSGEYERFTFTANYSKTIRLFGGFNEEDDPAQRETGDSTWKFTNATVIKLKNIELLTLLSTNPGTVFDGFTVTSDAGVLSKGMIMNQGTIRNCTFKGITNNVTNSGALKLDGGSGTTVYIKNCAFVDNSAQNYGNGAAICLNGISANI